jgi:hypothetical protein
MKYYYLYFKKQISFSQYIIVITFTGLCVFPSAPRAKKWQKFALFWLLNWQLYIEKFEKGKVHYIAWMGVVVLQTEKHLSGNYIYSRFGRSSDFIQTSKFMKRGRLTKRSQFCFSIFSTFSNICLQCLSFEFIVVNIFDTKSSISIK